MADLDAVVVGCGPGPFTGSAGRDGHRGGLRARFGDPGVRGVQPGRHRCETEPPQAMFSWSPTPVVGRCTGRATATACGSTGRRVAAPGRRARRRGGGGGLTGSRGAVRAAAPVAGLSDGGGTGARRRRLGCERRRRWCRCTCAGPTPRPLAGATGGGADDGRDRRVDTGPTPRAAPSWKRSCSTATTRGPRAAFLAELEAKHNHYVAARTDGTLVGYAGIARLGRKRAVRIRGAHHRRRPRVSGPGHRPAAAGRVCSTFADGGVIFLEVRTDNAAAIALYESVGFAGVGVRKRYYRASGADAYTMRRRARSRHDGHPGDRKLLR